jgi:hypothetical protein
MVADLTRSSSAASGRLAFYNDSDVIELEGVAPPPPPEDGGGIEGSAGAGNSGAGSIGEGEEDTGSTITGGSSSGGGGGGGTGGSGSSGSLDELLQQLLESGVFAGSSDILGADGSGFSGGIIQVTGDAVRAAFTGRSDLRDILEAWKSLRETRGASARDYGLMAVSTALSDENIEDIAFTAEAFSVTYRSRGYLLSIFPWRFPVVVTVVPQAPEGSRVTVKLPWYRFFVREFFTADGLAAELEGTLKSAAAPAAADERAVLFDAVAKHLRDKIGTVSNSIILGG